MRTYRLPVWFLFSLTGPWAAGGAGATAEPLRSASLADRPSASGAGNSSCPVLSADGRSLAFVSHANNLVTNDDHAPHLDLFVRDLASNVTVLVSVSTNGLGGANEDVGCVALSSNGQFIAFETVAGNLAPNDSNGASDVFVRNLRTGLTRIISVDASGGRSGNGGSWAPRLSADGRYLAFESAAANLVTNDFNGTNDVFIRDLVTGVTRLVSVNSDGSTSADGPSHSPALSSDGQRLAFVSHAPNLVSGATNRLGEVYARDLVRNSTLWMMGSHIAPARDSMKQSYAASDPTVSADGRYVAFKSASGAVLRFDTLLMTNTVVIPGRDGDPLSGFYYDNPRIVRLGNGLDRSPLRMSEDGRYVAFATGPGSPLPGPGPAAKAGVYRIDFETLTVCGVEHCCDGSTENYTYTNFCAQTSLISTNLQTNSLGALPSQSFLAMGPAMSSDGRRFVFLSGTRPSQPAPALGAPLGLYLRDLTNEVAVLLSTNRAGLSPADLSGIMPALSPDGRFVAWDSPDAELVADDLNRAWDVFSRDLQNLQTGKVELVSSRHPDRPGLTGVGRAEIEPGALSRAGSRILVVTLDSNLAPNDTNEWPDIVLRDLEAGTNTLLSGALLVDGPVSAARLHFPTNSAVWPSLSADGRFAVFGRAGRNNGLTNIYWRDLLTGRNELLVQTGLMASRPSLSADGLLVAFASEDDLFGPDVFDFNDGADIALSDLRSVPPITRVVSVSPSGFFTGDRPSFNPLISPDGRWVAFLSRARDLTEDIVSGGIDLLFVRDLTRGLTRLVSYPGGGSSSGFPMVPGATNPVFSANSRYLAFRDGLRDVIYRHDLLSDLGGTGPAINLLVCTNCDQPSLSADGRFISYAMPGSSGTAPNIFVQDLQNGISELESVNLSGTSGGDGASFTPLMSADARFIVFASEATDLAANDTNRATDIFVRDRPNHVTLCVSRNWRGTGPGNHVSSHPVLSPDGRTVAFQSFASDLVPGDYNDTRDVFVLTLASADADGDGLDDDWEMVYFSTLARDGRGDFDQDGASDLAEFRSGTNPADGRSVFRVLTLTTALGPGPGLRTSVVFWTAVPGRSYRLQYADEGGASEAEGTEWFDVPGEVMASESSASKLHSGPAGSGRRFYRVLLLP